MYHASLRDYFSRNFRATTKNLASIPFLESLTRQEMDVCVKAGGIVL